MLTSVILLFVLPPLALTFSPTPVLPLSALPTTFTSASHPQDPTAELQIRNTLSLYPLIIDGKAFEHLDLVFTRDVYANYSAPLGVLNGTDALAVTLQKSLEPVDTQHLLGTCVVQFLGKDDARTVTYFQASHFGRGLFNGQVLYAYGAYDDSWVKVGKAWRVRQRSLVHYGPGIGNVSIFS
ncbi:SnoaL-like domain-containing protein [Mycena alexandri]|uniref:SnoaL-like domain-containing protein n=1 Tax=Mycena alexandri TaxID=1745969 RepID=A0AAD6WLG6_9AGAR|nr:SnoaL-like domain-containing protein [Mycena alexandri]